MDPRVEEHARVVTEHSIDLRAGDEVLIMAPPAAEALVVALEERIGERGAYSLTLSGSSRGRRAFMRAMDPDDYESPPDALMAVAEAVDALINVRASRNTHETGDVSPEKTASYAQVMKPLQDAITEKRRVITQHPAPGDAQAAEMSTEGYADFVYDAVTKDWDEQREFQQNMVEILDGASEVRIVSGETTDLTMSVEGMIPVNDYAERNLPGGEVFTAPVPDSVEGEALFDMPLVRQGREVGDVHLVFEDGEVVEYGAAKNEELLASVLSTDEGSSRLGELGIGMNRDIDRFTYNMLFDEKMGDTVHMALGRTIEDNLPADREGNDSAVHMDMIVDMSEDSRIEVDGEVVQRDGTFTFEE